MFGVCGADEQFLHHFYSLFKKKHGGATVLCVYETQFREICIDLDQSGGSMVCHGTW